MSVRINIIPETCRQFKNYLEDCIKSDAKTIDLVKEYFIAKHVQQVIHKLEIIISKYKIAQVYKVKSIRISELEVLALHSYFSRYQLQTYLIPLEQEILETLRSHYPQLFNVLKQHQVLWQKFIEESDFAG
jgi:hypothetical protein